MKEEYDFSGAERARFHTTGPYRLPAAPREQAWEGPDGPLGQLVASESAKTLAAYREQPKRITEDANTEHDTAHGGYAHRQLYELVQNSADALSQADAGQTIVIRLTERFLYCADDGKPIDEDGVTGLMFAHMSSKRGTAEIGRFGMGFKSVLGVTDAPEFFSRSGAIRFDRNHAAVQIGHIAPERRYPALRLPQAIDTRAEAALDDDLREMMGWATNIVRLPLKAGAFEDLDKQIDDFPPEFLLFVPHVRYLTLEHAGGNSRELTLAAKGDTLELTTGDGTSPWRAWETTHVLSAAAREDSRTLDDAGEVQLVWAVPLDSLDRPGHFWAFFPTQTASLLAGILNAPWKTNEDRQNLLTGPYNDELTSAAARLVADALPSLATPSDPARHLDALPRREEAGDGEHSKRLRRAIVASLEGRAIVPDQDGCLSRVTEVHYAPEELTPRSGVVQDSLDQWMSYASRPKNWVHHTALTRNRLARLNVLWQGHGGTDCPRAALAEWLVGLREGWAENQAVEASKAAIKVAALLPPSVTSQAALLGDIVLTQGRHWQSPDPTTLFLPPLPPTPDGDGMGHHLVHVDLATDELATSDLRRLGIREQSADRTLALMIGQLSPSGFGLLPDLVPDDGWWRQFWQRARTVDIDEAMSVLEGSQHRLRYRTVSGEWEHADSVLLPGEIVPPDGSRDADVAVDVDFHARDLDLLRRVGVTDRPGECDLSLDTWFRGPFTYLCRQKYKSRDLQWSPREWLLVFETTRSVGPLHVMTLLSSEGRARYVDALLRVEASYRSCTMLHKSQSRYPKVPFLSPVLAMIQLNGRIRCGERFFEFNDALGQPPKVPDAQRALLAHPMAGRIRKAFGLSEPRIEAIGEEDPIPLGDARPGAPASWSSYTLVRCQRIVGDDGSEPLCVRADSSILLVSTGSTAKDISLVAGELQTVLDESELDAMLRLLPDDEVERRRSAVREQPSNAAKLLCAVGESALKRRLPTSFVSALQAKGEALTGVSVAEAAIATFHTRALFECRSHLHELEPPVRWAGSPRAVAFVQSLGFAPEWAGERQVRRAPFVQVEGPLSLPDLHGYQERIVDNVTALLRNQGGGGVGRRGMISLPTGAGKTRIAVQAIVQAMRDSVYAGGVLWVADRDELCEQAVEAWRQVWAWKGVEATPLRISRMWDQQPAPMATNELHVVVATIQTLYAKLSKDDPAYRFIADFGLVVFDEAHRSIARSYTSVMAEIGLTRWRRSGEPILLGLTATPYRGHDEAETARLVNRYGSNRLDNGAFASRDPNSVVGELQGMGVLAQADHETIVGGSFTLTKNEVAELAAMPRPAWLPRSIEQRIASDTNRTLGIVAAYERHVAQRASDWPTLIFATSVEHSQTVAALLNTRGITARAVSGTTDRAVRRRIVDDFRSGRVQVLVNYGVFREGFDAPKTRAIVVARPVYSPNLYFQMIGRGLRGPKNGGSERCLIINVQDNIDNFDRQLAFADLDWLWA